MRSIDELIELDDPRWPEVQSWIADATNPVTVLPPEASTRADALYATQVTTRSPMGAIIFETGGLILDSGWIRILGSGCPNFSRSLPAWNRECGMMVDNSPPPFLLIADDAVGGFFAINGGVLGEDTGNIYYFAPDTLQWEPMEFGYTGFLSWAFAGDLQGYYADFRWPKWELEVANLSSDRSFSFYPPLWTEAKSLRSRHRGTVPILEAFTLQLEFAQKINARPA